MMNHSDTKNGCTLNVEGPVARLTLDRPDKHNAFDDALIEHLISHLSAIEANPSVRVLILEAKGKHFCAGADLGWMKRMASLNYDENLSDARKLAELMAMLNSLSIPTIARVQGAAYGGAIGLIACCDIALASDTAKFCLSEVKLGLAPATIAPYVVAAMGARRCRRLFLTAEVFSAEQALQYELVHETSALEDLDEALDRVVRSLLSGGPKALRAAKQLVKKVTHPSQEDFEYTSKLIAELRVSDEGQEGLGAFFDKRKASWCDS